MNSLKAKMLQIAESAIMRLLILWNPPVEIQSLTIDVTYTNGEKETMGHDREIKIDLDGTIYFKEGTKGKWEPYPEIRTMTLNFTRIRRPAS